MNDWTCIEASSQNIPVETWIVASHPRNTDSVWITHTHTHTWYTYLSNIFINSVAPNFRFCLAFPVANGQINSLVEIHSFHFGVSNFSALTFSCQIEFIPTGFLSRFVSFGFVSCISFRGPRIYFTWQKWKFAVSFDSIFISAANILHMFNEKLRILFTRSKMCGFFFVKIKDWAKKKEMLIFFLRRTTKSRINKNSTVII